MTQEKTLIVGKIERRRRRGWQRMRCLDGIINLMDMSLSRLQELVMDREDWRAAVHEVTKLGPHWATKLNWTPFLPWNTQFCHNLCLCVFWIVILKTPKIFFCFFLFCFGFHFIHLTLIGEQFTKLFSSLNYIRNLDCWGNSLTKLCPPLQMMVLRWILIIHIIAWYIPIKHYNTGFCQASSMNFSIKWKQWCKG